MEEFALCWNKLKFAENLSTGFQTLFDRGDFVDCTIACDGQLLQCHKLVLAICSPYFKEIFINNPCRHPIIILKDVSYSIMSELLQFMYQGEVNVKQAELQSFMSIAESLQIKGLATNTNNNNNNNNTHNVKASDPVISTFSQFHANNSITRNNIQHQFNSGGNHAENHRQITSTPLSTTSSVDNHSAKALKMNETPTSPFGQKRTMDQINTVERQNQMKIKRNQMMNDISGDSDMNDSIDNMTSDDMFLPQAMQPQVTINESPRFDTNSVKREVNDVTVSQPQSPNNSYRGLQYQNSNMNSMHNATFPYNFSDFSNNDMTMQNESKPSIHMDIPAGTSTNLSNVTIRSYRLTTCRARCITAQGRIMSTTGTHNHPPHVKNSTGAKIDLPIEQTVAGNIQTFAQPLSNQIPSMPSPTMINQQQMNANMNFGASNVAHNNNFSMTNILNSQLSDIDPNGILSQPSLALNQLDSNIQITPIISASLDNLQIAQQHQTRNLSNMNIDTIITSSNN
ncbi:CLUMA_CG006853, isoform C [Clunio marinus]|uniref:CLUMA_CG006853, isoform C n=1 Tax=Clunio marinus TaxID=568069 RepID=A0A1J1HYY1_9DIPT|nr:CLUMA_CG006853, isoform C [Clunio marinus]